MFFRIASLFFLFSLSPISVADSIGKFHVEITGLDDPLALSNAQRAVELYQQSLHSSDAQLVADYDWQRFLETAPSDLQDAIRPYGYYQSRVSVTLQDKHNVTLHVIPGDRVVVSERNLKVQGEASTEDLIRQWLDDYPLTKGGPLIQPDYDVAKSELSTHLRRLGYFDARFTAQSIRMNELLTAAAIDLHVDSGPRYRYGNIDIIWRDESQRGSYSNALIERYLSIKEGDEFDSEQLQELQSRFTDSAYFSYAEVRPQIGSASNQQVPLQLSLEAPKRYVYGASLGVGTDTGPRAGINYEDRRFNPHGHRLQVTASASEIRQSLVSNYIIPRNSDPRDGITLFASIFMSRLTET
jgi:translocation and assembly module TamA